MSIVEPSPPTPGPEKAGPLLQVTLDIPRGRVTLAGELDLATVHALREALAVLASGASRPITIDLTDLHFIDACGLGEIARIAAWLRRSGERLTLARPSARIQRTFGVAGLADLL